VGRAAPENHVMLDVIVLLKRAEGIPGDTFRERWLAGGSDHYGRDPNCTRYIQCPVLSEPLAMTGKSTIDVSIDGFEKISFADPAALDQRLASEGLSALRDITGAMTIHAVRSHVIRDQVSGGGADLLKRLVLVKRNPEVTSEQYLTHWFDIHAPLTRKVVGGARVYVQHQALGEIANPVGIRSLQLGLDGFSETWYDDEAELRRAAATLAGQAVARDNMSFGNISKRFYFEQIAVKGE
jgi:uncharacterized protein (TIGR02118 family)